MSKTVSAAFLTTACLLVSASAYGHPGDRLDLDTVATFAGESPESIAIDHAGNAYYSFPLGGTVQKRTPDGHETTFATLPIAALPLGVKVGPDGCIYNVSTSLDPTVVGAFAWRTCTAGTTAQVFATLDPSGGPNDLAFDDHGNLFVTDPFLGRVYKIKPNGAVSVWLQDPLLDGNPAAPALRFHAVGVDGIAFDEDKENLYLGNLDYGRIVRVPIRSDGSAGSPSVVVSDPRLVGVDGIAFDDKGTLFAAINAQDALVSVSRRGRVTVLASGPPLDGTASVAFGTREADERKLYVLCGAFMRVFGLEAGTPHPVLLTARTDHEGLRLP